MSSSEAKKIQFCENSIELSIVNPEFVNVAHRKIIVCFTGPFTGPYVDFRVCEPLELFRANIKDLGFVQVALE